MIRPFAQQDKLTTLEIVASLTPVQAKVLFALGAFTNDAFGASVKILCQYTKLSRPSVSTALDCLCVHEYAGCFVDGDGVRRYRPMESIYRSGGESVSILDLAPVLESSRDERHVKTAFTSPVVVKNKTQQESFDFDNKQTNTRARETFLRLGVAEPALSRLSRTVPAENAEAWREWSQEAPRSFRDPLAYLIKRLSDDPAGAPPQVKRKHWWNDEYDQFVQR